MSKSTRTVRFIYIVTFLELEGSNSAKISEHECQDKNARRRLLHYHTGAHSRTQTHTCAIWAVECRSEQPCTLLFLFFVIVSYRRCWAYFGPTGRQAHHRDSHFSRWPVLPCWHGEPVLLEPSLTSRDQDYIVFVCLLDKGRRAGKFKDGL